MAITGVPARFPAGRRILTYENPIRYTESSDELTVSSSDSVFGFLEGSVESTTSSEGDIFEVEEEEENSGNSFEENKKFWENQYHLLQATMCRTTGVETGIRSLTKEALKQIQAEGGYCKCRKPVTGNNCRICLMKEVCGRLNNAGFNCAVCRSKWRSSSEIPSDATSRPSCGDFSIGCNLVSKLDVEYALMNNGMKSKNAPTEHVNL